MIRRFKNYLTSNKTGIFIYAFTVLSMIACLWVGLENENALLWFITMSVVFVSNTIATMVTIYRNPNNWRD